MNEEDYDVVIETLQKQIDILWKMTKSNMDNNMMNIMDDIRLKQMDELNQAITLWKENNETM
jgi:virulence-associated protein VagC